MGSLVPARITEGVEAYVIPRSPIVKPGSSLKADVVIASASGRKQRVRATVEHIFGNRRAILLNREIDVGSGFHRAIEVPFTDKPGEHRLAISVNGRMHDEAVFIVAEPPSVPTYFTFVWHNHQAPNYLPDGRIHGPWAFVYVWGKQLAPYGYGPYHYHAALLSRKKELKATYNLSPSLLRQWTDAIENGVVLADGKRFDPGSPEVSLIRETLENYRHALSRGQIDVLTSLYAHTIAGFLVDVLGAGDIVDEEISYGREITKATMGGFEPQGIWTPEMAFSMRLVPIYSANGITYTILDSEHHYKHAAGDKGVPYEPYMLIDAPSGSYITVFFRDHELSNIISFMNNFETEAHAWRNAYETALRIASRIHRSRPPVLVIALDGENWMVFSRKPPLTAFYLDKLTDYVMEMHRRGFIASSHLNEILRSRPPRRVLKHVPTNTWLGTFRKWRGERREHEEYWLKAAEKIRILRAYEEMIGGRDEASREGRWCLWHALDSDYWWAEFWSPSIIDAWLREFDKRVTQAISLVRIEKLEFVEEPVEGRPARLLIKIRSRLRRRVKLCIILGGVGASFNSQSTIRATIDPDAAYEHTVEARVSQGASRVVVIAALATASGYIADVKSMEARIAPSLPPNPI